MELVKQEYHVAYTLYFGLVRSSASGKFEGIDYSSSVRITSSNVYDVENNKTKTTDSVEQKIVFKIPCPDDITAGLVATAIKEKLKKGEPIYLEGGFPVGDQNVINVSTPYNAFLYPSKPADKTDKASKGA